MKKIIGGVEYDVQELIEVQPNDYYVDVDGCTFLMKLIRIGPNGSRRALENGIAEPTTLPEFTDALRPKRKLRESEQVPA